MVSLDSANRKSPPAIRQRRLDVFEIQTAVSHERETRVYTGVDFRVIEHCIMDLNAGQRQLRNGRVWVEG